MPGSAKVLTISTTLDPNGDEIFTSVATPFVATFTRAESPPSSVVAAQLDDQGKEVEPDFHELGSSTSASTSINNETTDPAKSDRATNLKTNSVTRVAYGFSGDEYWTRYVVTGEASHIEDALTGDALEQYHNSHTQWLSTRRSHELDYYRVRGILGICRKGGYKSPYKPIEEKSGLVWGKLVRSQTGTELTVTIHVPPDPAGSEVTE